MLDSMYDQYVARRDRRAVEGHKREERVKDGMWRGAWLRWAELTAACVQTRALCRS
jgi:hypothetical protein